MQDAPLHARTRPGTATWQSALVLVPLLAAALGLQACDSPACVFGGNCGDPPAGGGLGSAPATFPADHEWIVPGVPAIEDVRPNGGTVATTTPLAVRFRESMSEASLDGGFALIESGPFGEVEVALHPPTLTGGGRLALLRPVNPLTAGSSLELRVADDADISDLEGLEYAGAAGTVLASFDVEAVPSTELGLVATYPADGDTDQSPFVEVAAVFDRPVDPLSISPASFAVLVGGAAPAFNPLAERLLVNDQGGATSVDGRVLRWRSVDTTTGTAQDLGAGAMMELRLSSAGAPLTPEGGGSALAPATAAFESMAFHAPDTIVLNTASGTAIGIDDLVGTTTLTVDLTFQDATDGDRIDLYLFGRDLADTRDIALLRSKTLSGAPLTDTWDAADVDLAPQSTPVDPRLGEGSVAFAYRTWRGGLGSPVRLLDVDALLSGIQDPLLDTVAPTLVGFGADGGDLATLRSTVRDLGVLGVADEELAAVDVDAGALGTNGVAGTPTPASGGNPNGLFLARPVLLTGGPDPGLLDAATAQSGAPFTAVLYDRALNPSTAYAGTFFQVGASGPAALLPGTIDVEVLRGDTLRPLSGARVWVHDAGSGALIDQDVTPGSGIVSLMSAAAQTLVTVEASSYGLFSMQDVPTARLSVVLQPSGSGAGLTSGIVRSSDAALGTLDRSLGDSRRLQSDEPLLGLLTCAPNLLLGTTDCPFGPAAVGTYTAGALGFVGVTTPSDAASFDPVLYLRAFALDLPRPALDPGQVDNANLTIDRLLDDPATPPTEVPVDGADVTYTDSLASSDGVPRVSVEAVANGLTGTVPAGAAVAFDQGGSFRVRAAVPGAAAGGDLVADQVLGASLALRLESRDAAGNRTGRRPTFTPPAVLSGSFTGPGLPTITSPALGATTAGPSYTIDVTDVVPTGVVIVTLVGSNGRTWTLLRPDQAGPTSLLVPDVGAAGGTGLPSGAVFATSAAYELAGFDPGLFLFSDVARRHDRFGERIDHSYFLP